MSNIDTIFEFHLQNAQHVLPELAELVREYAAWPFVLVNFRGFLSNLKNLKNLLSFFPGDIPLLHVWPCEWYVYESQSCNSLLIPLYRTFRWHGSSVRLLDCSGIVYGCRTWGVLVWWEAAEEGNKENGVDGRGGRVTCVRNIRKIQCEESEISYTECGKIQKTQNLKNHDFLSKLQIVYDLWWVSLWENKCWLIPAWNGIDFYLVCRDHPM